MDPQRVAFWIELIVQRSEFPAPQLLAAQFAAAEFSEFCDCGCNSFAVTIPRNATVLPFATPTKGEGAVFECSFRLSPSDKSVEIMLFADAAGNLSYVEIDCNANSQPVPDLIHITGAPYHVHASSSVAP